MKRISVWLLAVLLLWAAVACAASEMDTVSKAGSADTATAPAGVVPAAPPEKEETEKQEPEKDAAVPPENALPPEEPQPETVTYAVERDIIRETILAEDGTKVAETCIQLPLLQAIGTDGTVIIEPATELQRQAVETAAAFNAKFDAWRQENTTLKMYAQGDYQQWPEKFRLGIWYSEELDFSVWKTERLVSIRGDSYSYYGGAHPNTVLLGWNFDLVSGTYINALSIGHDEQEFRTLVAEELILRADERAAALQQEPADMYWQDYRSILMNWSDYPVVFGSTGMTVRFSAYELGSYAAGSHEFTISYAFLEPYLGDYGRELLGLTAVS